ncbi:MAG TPA: hypothetical protein VK762_02950 [Polyangiaceae bacterium]|nr:hypothetical protein [Polyangiaceae bacterium]
MHPGPIRAIAPWTAAAIAFAVGCGHAGAAPDSAIAGRTDGAIDRVPPRAPDGVVLDAPPVLPEPLSRSPAQGVVSLREPPGQDAIATLVQSFLDGWRRESLETLLGLATPDAGLIDGPDHGHAALVESWRQRLHAHEYNRLAGSEIVRPERIERWGWDELGTAPSPARPPAMHAGEELVRVPIEVTRIAGERVFGDVLTLIVKHQDGRLRIVGYGESDAP